MRVAKLMVAAAMCVCLAACAGVGSQHKLLPSDDIDVEKVQLVDRWALDHGARVIWVNYPLKTHPQSADGS